MKIFSNLSRFLLIAILCLAGQPGQPTQAQLVTGTPTGLECPTAFVKNEYAADAAPSGMPVPLEPLEILFENQLLNASYVQGQVAPDTEVTMQVYIQNTLGWTVKTRSDADGYYRVSAFRPTECSDGLPYHILEGHRVQISAGGQSYATVAHAMTSVAVDPRANTVSGQVKAGLMVEITLTEPISGALCDDTAVHVISGSATAKTDKSFLAALDDFGGRAVAALRIQDGTGSSVTRQEARRVTLDLNQGYLHGLMIVNGTVTYTLSRGGQVMETSSRFQTNYIGYQFTAPLQPGDVIEANAASGLLYHAVVSPLSGTMDLENDQITGQAAPNQPVYAGVEMYISSGMRFNHCWDTPVPTLCGAAGENGAYSISGPLDLRAGDTALLTQYDENGNAQTRQLDSVPVILVDPYSRAIESYFPSSSPVTITVRDNQGAALWQQTSTYPNYMNGYLWSLPNDLRIEPGQVVEVSDGASAKTMTIPDVTVDPLYGQQQVSGSAPDGTMLILYLDNDFDHQEYRCVETRAANGRFSAAAGSLPYFGIDEFQMVYDNDQGGYLGLGHVNRYLIVSKDAPGAPINGAVEQNGKPLTLTHLRDGSPLVTYPFVSDGLLGTFYGSQSNSIPFQQGDRLVVEGDGIPTFEMDIPQLDASIDTASQRVVGHAAGSRAVYATLSRTYSGSSQANQRIRVFPDAQGNFSEPLPALKDSSNCRVFPANGCMQVGLISFTPEGNVVGWNGPSPVGVTADSYEPDDTRETARIYTNQPQTHTMLALNEVDMVKFEVSPLEVGRKFTLTLSDMGWMMGLNYELIYANDPYGFRSGSFWEGSLQSIDLIPTKAGTYYLKLKTAPSSYTFGSCDSAYTLTIQRPLTWNVYLPFVEQ